MELCPSVSLGSENVSKSFNFQNDKTQDESKMEVDSTNPDLEIIKENIIEKKERKKITPILISKNVKVKVIKPKKILGEKRKLSDKSETGKKIKRRKKEDKLIVNDFKSVSKVQLTTPEEKKESLEYDEGILVIHDDGMRETPEKAMSPKTSDPAVENNLESEAKEKTEVKAKSKRSSKKSKVLANSCKTTLETLLKLELESLLSIDKSLKILKDLHLLNNKHLPIDTLIDLITLAVETSQGSKKEEVEKETSLSNIISKLIIEMSNSPKNLKARKSLLSVSFNSKDKTSESPGPTSTPKVNVSSDPVTDQEKEKAEESDATLELTEKNLEQTVEKSGKNFCITNYFKKLKKTVDERDKNDRFSLFMAKVDMSLAPKLGGELVGDRREKFELEFSNQTCEVQSVFKENPKYLNSDKRKSSNGRQSLEMTAKDSDSMNDVEMVTPAERPPVEIISANETENKSSILEKKKITPLRVDPPKILPTVPVGRTKAKLLQFHENRRPPYWGTWRRKSETVGPRRPFQMDKLLNYDVDSDDEWEEEEEPGESLHGSDDEKEPEEDYEVDNDFFVPHGYLSDDENPEKENISPKTKLDLMEKQFTFEQKQKTSKMTPFVFGTFWIHTSDTSEGSQYHDLQIQNLQIIPWVTTPIEIPEEDDKKVEALNEQGESGSQIKKRHRIQFPDEEVPNLIKMVHGSSQNIEFLAKKFLLYWDEEKVHEGPRYGLTKVCVLKKIKEIASYQTKTWLVPKEVRKEFGASVEDESPPKKPQKCFIWNFVKRAEKNTDGTSSPSGNPEPEVVVL